tara:strand:- start:106 stop:942 length:837 start_codon:yes stop_codon:yes gene_type:complete
MKKCSENIFVNILGYQPFKYLLAHLIYNFKKTFIYNSVDNLNAYKNGFFIKKNFINFVDFKILKIEFRKILNNKNLTNTFFYRGISIQECNVNKNLNVISKKYPQVFKLSKNPQIKKFFKNHQLSKKFIINISLMRVQNFKDNKHDAQKFYHTDTFFNTFKAWITMNDWNDNNGPLMYLKNSHLLNFKRIILEYINSIDYSFRAKNLSKKKRNIIASWRLSKNGKKDKVYDKEAIKMNFKENCFIFANTHGFHRRGNAKENTIRETILISVRENPFSI